MCSIITQSVTASLGGSKFFPRLLNCRRKAMASFTLLVLLAFLSICESTTRRPLGKFIKHYEPLYYDAPSVHKLHRRSVEAKEMTDFQFSAFGKSHQLRLQPDRGLFTRDAKILTGDGKPIPFDRDAVVEGKVVGQPRSKVIGVFDEGVFHGKIMTNDDVYYVDPSSLHFDEPQDFPSVIYKSQDVHYEYNYPDISKRIPEPLPEERTRRSNEDDLEHNKEHLRVRRLAQSEIEKNACVLGLYVDKYFTNLFGSKTKAIFQLTTQVRAVQIIYSKEFNSSYPSYGLTFRVQSVTVLEDNAPESPDNLGIDTLLDIFSTRNHDEICEAFLFTDRNFDGGILGLAWIGSTTAAGGICNKNRNFGGGKKRSYNTGIVTMKLYGQFTPPKVSEITFAHELGHGFGSQHGPNEDDCIPGGKDGNYIMYDKATTGDKLNNDKFSACSIKSIVQNVNNKRSKHKECFIKSDQSICGNKLVEKDEQCDCGTIQTCTESCCEPQGSKRQCKRKLGKTCSPSEGPCCSEKCKYSGPGITCKNTTDCTEVTTCSGVSSKCPVPKPVQNGTTCDESRRVCYSGECSKSVCLKYGLEACDCTDKDEDMCSLCCKNGQSQCKPAASWTEMPSSLHGVKLRSGTPCDNLNGFCDAFAVCRLLDMEGPLLRLKKQFFTVEGVKELASKYWWAILLGCIVLVVLLALMIKLCTVYTPSHNPSREAKKPAKPLPKRKKRPQQGQRPMEMQQNA